jgi:DNA-binding NarL/FixJ family response regulator
MINVLIVDDRDIIRDSLKLFLLGNQNIKVKDEASDGKEALDLIEKNDYDLVLMDINMPNMNGIEATQNILKIKPKTKILASSFYLSPMHIKEMVSAGVVGFIKKGESKKNYVKAIETVVNGSIFLSDEISYKIYNKAVSYLRFSDKKEISKTENILV